MDDTSSDHAGITAGHNGDGGLVSDRWFKGGELGIEQSRWHEVLVLGFGAGLSYAGSVVTLPPAPAVTSFADPD